MGNVLSVVAGVCAAILAMIQLAERPGDGAEKREAVINGVLEAVAALALPWWARLIFCNKIVLGIMIDLAVGALNKAGWTSVKPIEVPATG